MRSHSHLRFIKSKLQLRLRQPESNRPNYAIPGLWSPPSVRGSTNTIIKVNPCRYFIRAIDRLLQRKPEKIAKGPGGEWTRDAVIYNMFLRSTCAFDHDMNGSLDLPVNKYGWRETGTFLKAIVLLPYIKSLGVNTIHLLPITAIGADGNKGSLGSPYAIRNPYELDDNLREPNLGSSVGDEFRAFVEGAHRLGIRVVVEFVFRTSAKDGDWIKEHPEWFYWIRATIEDRLPGERDETKYGNPIFTEGELNSILNAVDTQRYGNLLPPHEVYRQMFTRPPLPASIVKENGRWIGRLPDGTRVRIPGAFADWPPHDSQPPWGDVTYLKLYDHPDFDYIAYNTIRMYDNRLAQPENVNKTLWEKISDIVPHYQHEFGIDGVMIDMGHALPMELKHEIIRRARGIDPDFAFWDENFSVNAESVKEGYNAVIGYLWSDQHHPERFKNLLRICSSDGFPLPFFSTPESHNTPRAASRAGGVRYSRYAWAIGNFLPGIPFIHSGFELGEKYPINTGLDFSAEELDHYPPNRLPLFSEYAYLWTNKDQFVDWIRRVSSIRRRYASLIVESSPRSFSVLETDQPDIIAFERSRKGVKQKLFVLANSNMNEARNFQISLQTKKVSVVDLLTKKKVPIRHFAMNGKLSAGQVCVFVL